VTAIFRPVDASQVSEVVRGALARGGPLEVRGAGSKLGLGRPGRPSERLDLLGLSGVSLYEPEELVMRAAAGTPLTEVEAELARHGQQLAFEPPDYGPLFGEAPGRATLGGVFACNLSGPRRIRAGAARDHLLGVSAVSGRGEVFKAGGRVVKNVTGYDLCKLLAGSYGTLAVLTELTFKVLPRAEAACSVALFDLDDAAASAALSCALRLPCDVSGAVHLPPRAAGAMGAATPAGGRATTVIRIEGPRRSVEERRATVAAAFEGRGELACLHDEASSAFWRAVRDVQPFRTMAERQLWRLSLPPSDGHRAVSEVRRELDAEVYYDWGGGLVWLGLTPRDDAGHEVIRAAVGRHGGHATLVRAADAVRAAVPVFPPEPPAVAGLTARLVENFDPHRLLNPGRMYPGI
jgi:glycolate oxidase FAD binding subunit